MCVWCVRVYMCTGVYIGVSVDQQREVSLSIKLCSMDYANALFLISCLKITKKQKENNPQRARVRETD